MNYLYWLLGVSAFFVIAERLRPARRTQPLLRRQILNDTFYLLFNGHFFSLLAGTLVGLVVEHSSRALAAVSLMPERGWLDTQPIAHPLFPSATIRTPLIVKLDAADRDHYLAEWFGPIAFVIATDSTAASLAIARDAVKAHGALTLSVYSRRQDVIDRAIGVAEEAGVALSINLTGGVFVNQSAAFSDFHGTGANPAANAALTDAAFVASRFRVIQHRMHV